MLDLNLNRKSVWRYCTLQNTMYLLFTITAKANSVNSVFKNTFKLAMLDFYKSWYSQEYSYQGPLVCLWLNWPYFKVSWCILLLYVYLVGIHNACIIHLTIVLHIVLLKRLFSLLRIIIMVLSIYDVTFSYWKWYYICHILIHMIWTWDHLLASGNCLCKRAKNSPIVIL